MELHELRPKTAALDEELKAVFLSHGFKWVGRKATLSVDGNSLVYKIDLAIISEDGSTVDTDALRWKQYAGIYGLPVDGVGKTFIFQGSTFTIKGWRSGRSAKSVLAERNGKSYVFTPDTVKLLLARDQAVQSGLDKHI